MKSTLIFKCISLKKKESLLEYLFRDNKKFLFSFLHLIHGIQLMINQINLCPLKVGLHSDFDWERTLYIASGYFSYAGSQKVYQTTSR